jgi:hypothetical protein
MPPKPQKGKGPAATPTLFSCTQQSQVPAPIMLHPLCCRREQALLCCRGSLLVLRSDASRRLRCEVLAKDTLEPEPVALAFLDERRQESSGKSGQASGAISLDDIRVTAIAAQDGKCLALVRTEAHGLLIAGYFDGEETGDDDENGDFGAVKQLVPLRFAHQVPGTVLTMASVVTSTAVAKSFCLAVVLDIASGSSRVAGRGFTACGALGKAPARSGTSSTSALAAMTSASFPKHAQLPQLPFSAYEDSFASFRWLTELDVLSVTAVYAGNSLALLNSKRGLYAMGKLNDQHKFEGPTLVLDWPRPGTAPRSIAFTDSAVYCLVDGRTMYVLDQNSSSFAPSPLLNGLPEQVTTMRAGADHVVLVGEKTQRLYGWGNAAFGQLGPSNGPCKLTAPAAVQVPVTGPQQVVGVHCFGFRTVLAVRNTSTGEQDSPQAFVSVGKK